MTLLAAGLLTNASLTLRTGTVGFVVRGEKEAAIDLPTVAEDGRHIARLRIGTDIGTLTHEGSVWRGTISIEGYPHAVTFDHRTGVIELRDTKGDDNG